jgi:hypothetical protein
MIALAFFPGICSLMDRAIALLAPNNGGHCVILDECGNILQGEV